jgi:hypothetical protein
MSQQQNYKTFRVNINTTTLLDDFAPVLIGDISQKFQPIFQLKEDYCTQLGQNCTKLQAFSEFSNLTVTLRNFIQRRKDSGQGLTGIKNRLMCCYETAAAI